EKMTKRITLGVFISIISIMLVACGGSEEAENDKEGKDDKLEVMASFTIISDMAREIGGDKVEVHNLVPTGTDPHEYEPLPEDTKQATDADILFYNGLNLEGGDECWFSRLIDSVDQDEDSVCSLTEEVEPKYLEEEDSDETEITPHGFPDHCVRIKIAQKNRDALIEVEENNADYYVEQGNSYVDRLIDIEEDDDKRLSNIDEYNKTLVTSECDYHYLTGHY